MNPDTPMMQPRQIPSSRRLLMLLLGTLLVWSTGKNIVRVGQRYYRALATDEVSDPARKALLGTLSSLRTLPLAEKRQTLLFIPLHNRLYWEWPGERCDAVPFIAPAMTGMAMVDGLPVPDCQEQEYYGYAAYGWRSPAARLRLATDPAQLCDAVRKRGFSRVIIIDADADQQTTLERRNCS